MQKDKGLARFAALAPRRGVTYHSFPRAVHIGHPGWKAVGGRIGYSLATGVLVAVVCWLGLAALLLAIIPLVAILPILLFIGLVIGAQAFQASPAKHAPGGGAGAAAQHCQLGAEPGRDRAGHGWHQSHAGPGGQTQLRRCNPVSRHGPIWRWRHAGGPHAGCDRGLHRPCFRSATFSPRGRGAVLRRADSRRGVELGKSPRLALATCSWPASRASSPSVSRLKRQKRR